ncbi:MAG: hypothetical protein ACR2MO_04980 [Acidimicrobiales bacterium]
MADRTVRLGDAGLAGDTRARSRSRSRSWVAPEAGDAAVGRTGWPARVRALEERPRVVGPHARLGVVWFGLTMLALAAGRVGLVVLLAPCAGLAALQAVRSRRAHPRPSAPVAAAGAALLVAAAAVGPLAVGVVALALVGTVVAGVVVGGNAKVEPVFTLVAAVVIGVACASPVLLLNDGIVPVFVLLTFAAVHDASAYVVGTGAASAWEGPAAGAASIAAVTLGVAAVLVPPFRGATPWFLGGMAVMLAPIGPYVASALMGDRRANVPALRRIDSLLVLAPVWCLVAALVLE